MTVSTIDSHSYVVLIERGGTNFGAWVPDLPGCVATAKTLEECEMLIREAIPFHVEGLREGGDPVPEPSVAATAIVEA